MNTGYVYKLTHRETGQYYIGSRVANKVAPEEDIGRHYFTSSKVVEPLYRENPNAFSAEIVFTSEDSDSVFEYESNLIREVDGVADPLCFNIRNWPDCNPVKAAAVTHSIKDENGKSVTAVAGGKAGAAVLHANWNPEWSKAGGKAGAAKLHSVKDENGKSVIAMNLNTKIHSIKDENGKSVASVKGASVTHSIKDENGKSVVGIKTTATLNARFAHAREHREASPHWEQYQRQLQNRAEVRRANAHKYKAAALASSAKAKPFRDECKALCAQLGIKLGIHPVSSYDKFVTYRAQLQAMLSSKETVNG